MPYLANPTSCTAEPVAGEHLRALVAGTRTRSLHADAASARSADCDRLKLPATFMVAPTTQEAYAPTGLNAELGVHQTYEDAEGLASAHLNKAVVTLPEGMTVNPSAGAGLAGCTVGRVRTRSAGNGSGEGLSERIEARVGEDQGAGDLRRSVRVGVSRDAVREPVLRTRASGRVAARAVRRRADPEPGCDREVRGEGRSEPGDGSAHDDLRKPAAAAVHDVHAELPSGRDLAAGDPSRVRELHRDRAADAVVGPLAGVERRKPRVSDRAGLRWWRVPLGWCPAVQLRGSWRVRKTTTRAPTARSTCGSPATTANRRSRGSPRSCRSV